MHESRSEFDRNSIEKVGEGKRSYDTLRHALSITDMKGLLQGDHDLLMKFQVTLISPISSGANFWKRAGDMS